MTPYDIDFSNGMKLTVELDDTPIVMHIAFPSGKRVTFSHIPGKKPSGVVTVDEALEHVPYLLPIKAAATPGGPAREEVPAPLKMHAVQDLLGGPSIDYRDPCGPGMPCEDESQ